MNMKRSLHRHESGFTLVEILVTVVLISVGLLGIAALQLASLQSNKEAYVRAQASVLASDILDRMRANPLGFRNGEYNIAPNAWGSDPNSRAGRDIDDWQRAIDAVMPGGTQAAWGQIQRLAANPRVVTITITWSERRDESPNRTEADDGVRSFRTRSEI